MSESIDKKNETIYYLTRDDGTLVRVPESKLGQFDPSKTEMTEEEKRTAAVLSEQLKMIHARKRLEAQQSYPVAPASNNAAVPSAHKEKNSVSSASSSPRSDPEKPSRGVPVWVVIFLVLVIGILLGVIISRPKQPSGPTGTAALEAAMQNLSSPTPKPTAKPTAKPAPTATPYKAISGTLFIVPRGECLAPFTINAPQSSDCFVRLRNLSDSNNDVGVYVRAGSTASVDVPLGTYELYYATGLDWKGAGAKDNLVFGPDTQWHTSDETFRFYDDGEYYNGHTVTLYSVLNGNWSTEQIDTGDLPF